MAKRALIVWGGWDGHEPDKVANLFESILLAEGFEVEVSNSLDSFADQEKVFSQNLLVPIYTMSEITGAQIGPVLAAVAEQKGGGAEAAVGAKDRFALGVALDVARGIGERSLGGDVGLLGAEAGHELQPIVQEREVAAEIGGRDEFLGEFRIGDEIAVAGVGVGREIGRVGDEML